MKKIIFTLLAALSITCSPLLEAPTVELPERYKFGAEYSFESYTPSPLWWECFGDTTLNRIVTLAIDNNRDIRATLANVESARNYIAVAKSKLLPSLSLGAEVEAYRINGTTTKEYTLAPTLEWEISLFGKLRNTRKGAISKYLSSDCGYRAAMLTLTSEVATTLFTLAQYQRSLDIATRSYALRVEATALVDSMHRYGMSDGVALQQARSLVYSARIEIEKYRGAVEQSRLALNLLLGTTTTPDLELSLLDGGLPPTIPIGLPSDLVERRADVMESYFDMLSAAADVGVAHANRFPSISLTAEGGVITETLKNLSSAKPLGWSITGTLTQPLFNFGALKRSEKMAKEGYMAAMYQYEQAVISALIDVEQALVNIETDNHQALSTNSLVEANAKIALATSALYRGGMGDYLSVIDAQRSLYSSQLSLIEIRAEQYINHIDLVKALGGGF